MIKNNDFETAVKAACNKNNIPLNNDRVNNNSNEIVIVKEKGQKLLLLKYDSEIRMKMLKGDVQSKILSNSYVCKRDISAPTSRVVGVNTDSMRMSGMKMKKGNLSSAKMKRLNKRTK